MLNTFLRSIFGTSHDRQMKKIQPLVDQINQFESKISALADDQLKAKTPEFRARLEKGETLDDILPEAFAVCREASKRVLGMRHYDVQLIGGIVLNRGGISEMRTGEGKTLVATLPLYLNALSGKGAHLVTVNDYLVRRDAEWMGRLYGWLGLSTGVIVHNLTDHQRKAAYGCDITYATNNELGFDYLRDNMKFDLEEMVQKPLNFAIVDECDSILIDEARTPLIISGPAESSTEKYHVINKIIPRLQREKHFTIEEKSKTASLTEEGNSKVEELLEIDNLYDPQHIEILHHVNKALLAHHLYRLDVEYMIKDGEIVIVDEFTGRLMPGRRWSDGLHQAIEAKEGVEVKNENQTLATITFQNYFRMYNKLSGMTGTADTEAVEFKKIYNLDVTVIPTNRPIQRQDLDDVVYKTENAKFNAIIQDVKERHNNGQPILIGTASIEKSEKLSAALKREGIRHDVLNAKHHEREAEIIAQAGRKGSITIATNMAGRGTDIMLGGNAEGMARMATKATEGTEFEEALKKFREQIEKEKQEVLAAGGLYIVGTERHESRRIDNQLRGRSGRQGDPGASKFYLSLEDNLMRIFNGEMIQRVMTTLNVPEDEPITARMVTRSIEGAQKKVEGHNFDIRKHLLDYDNVMNQQRGVVYGLRKQIMAGENIDRTVLDFLGEVTSDILDTAIPQSGRKEEFNLQALEMGLQNQFGIKIDFNSLPQVNEETLTETVKSSVKQAFEHQRANLGPFYDQIKKIVLLQAIDQRWKEHLLRVDRLKEGINLRAHAQKDPLIEYKKEAFGAFEKFMSSIRSETIEKIMKVQVVAQEQAEAMNDMLQAPDMSDLNYQGAEQSAKAGFPTSAPSSAGSEAPQRQKMRMSAGPPPDSQKPLNRADRRRMDKGRPTR
ncbi:MAG: preprotein translocase subunit SecA [Pseudobdellovibrionaceae bacterium]